MIWIKSKSENCFTTIKMGVCEFSLFCEKIWIFFLRTKIHHFHEMETMKNEKTRNFVLCMVLTCCQLDKMWGKCRLHNFFFFWIGQIGSCIVI